MLRIETLAIGDELLTGKIADTNSSFVAGHLFESGLRLETSRVVPDEAPAIQSAMREAAERADFVICFGGLGPTSDDRTAETVAQLLGCGLKQDAQSLERLKQAVAKRGQELTPQRLKQVLHPEKSTALLNLVGSAPGFRCELGRAKFFFLPGVPIEMKPMFLQSVLPEIQKAQGPDSERIHSALWKCVGVPESELQRLMDPVEADLPKAAWLGYRTKFPENHLTLYWRGAQSKPSGFEAMAERIRKILGDLPYAEKEVELETIVVQQLRANKARIAFAESCTGGLCVQRVTKVPGSSDVVWGGTVVYQLDAKSRLLGVERKDDDDAVSRDCSRQIAEALKAKSECEVVVGVTGYMGPTGGTDEDPLGTFYVCVLGRHGALEKRVQHLGQSREANQWGAATVVLNLVRQYLK